MANTNAFPMNEPKNRLRGSLPKIGIRPVIDGRRRGVRESLEAQTMGMALAAKKLIEENLRHPCGLPVECVIADTTIGGVKEAADCAEKFALVLRGEFHAHQRRIAANEDAAFGNFRNLAHAVFYGFRVGVPIIALGRAGWRVLRVLPASVVRVLRGRAGRGAGGGQTGGSARAGERILRRLRRGRRVHARAQDERQGDE